MGRARGPGAGGTCGWFTSRSMKPSAVSARNGLGLAPVLLIPILFLLMLVMVSLLIPVLLCPLPVAIFSENRYIVFPFINMVEFL